jgi:hypothetical protein
MLFKNLLVGSEIIRPKRDDLSKLDHPFFSTVPCHYIPLWRSDFYSWRFSQSHSYGPCGAGGNTYTATVAFILLENNRLAVVFLSSKDTAFDTSATLYTNISVNFRDIVRMGNKIRALIFFQELKVMTAAFAATAQSEDILIGIIKGKVH